MLGHRRSVRFFLGALYCLLVTACDMESQPTQLTSSIKKDSAAHFDQLFKKHQSAQTHVGRYQIQLRFDHEGQRYDEKIRCDVQFTRPNQLQLTVTSDDDAVQLWTADGFLWAAIRDPARPGMSRQWVRRELPNQLTAAEIYAATEMLDPSQPNQMLSALTSLPISVAMTPIGMLLSDCGFTPLLQDPYEVSILEPATIENDACERFQLTTSTGSFIFWFAADAGTLRRVEYPTHALFQQQALDNRPQKVQLAIERLPFTTTDADRLPPQRPNNVQVLNYFVIPPNLLPTADYGKRIPEISFHDEDGNVIESGASSRPTVLTWFDEHDLSRLTLNRLQPLAEKYRDTVDFLAVSAALPGRVAAGTLSGLAHRWKVGLAMVYDDTAEGRDVLGISQAPTIVILDRHRQLQQYIVGANPNIGHVVDDTLSQILNGENVAATLIARAEREQMRFQQYLATASAESPEESMTHSSLADFRPHSLSLALTWHVTDVRPGNLSLLPNADGSPQSIAVVHGDHHITEVDIDGQVSARHQLNKSHEDPITFLRSTRIGDETIMIGFTPYGRSISVMNRQFHETGRFTTSKNQRVLDAQIADLDNDGTAELYVGFNDPGGCARISPTGQMEWSTTTVNSGRSMAIAGDEVWVASDQGLIHRFASDGAPRGTPQMLGKRPIHAVFSPPLTNGHQATKWLGLSHSLQGRPIAFAFGAELKESWSYGLTEGRYPYPVPIAQWTELLGPSGQWLLVGPDSSVHLVQDDGSFQDSFGLGHVIRGIVGHPTSNHHGRLYIATDTFLSGYELKRH